MFAELLSRSCFSLLQGASHPEELVQRAHDLGIQSLAICDRDGLYGSVRAFTKARELGQRVIVGAEMTLASPSSSAPREGQGAPPAEPLGEPPLDQVFSVVLLVENREGYQNLCRLLTLAHRDHPKGHAGLELDWLYEHHEGLWAIVPAPRVPQSKCVMLEPLFDTLKAVFGSRTLLGMYRHLDASDQARSSWVQAWSARYDLQVIASARPLYHEKSRKPLADVLYCIRHGVTLDQAGTGLTGNMEAHLRSPEQMRRLFGDHPEWVSKTAEIAERLCFGLDELRYHFPCELPLGQSADERLRELTFRGLERRYPGGVEPRVQAQIEKELALIEEIEVAPYFLSTWEIVEIARRRKILCQGRGSAANSAVCFALGITAVDPARSNLLFERFLSAERSEPPDIDIDFEHERREEVIQEIYQRYGRDRAAMVSEVICYRGKSALREVGKVFGLSLEQIDRLTSTITHWDAAQVERQRLLEMGLDAGDQRLQQVVRIAQNLQGFPRHLSIHVGGFVLSARPLSEVAPVEPARMEDRTVVPWDKDDLEELGFFKVDVLGLGMLTAIRKALFLIHRDGGLPPVMPLATDRLRAGNGAAERQVGAEPLASPLGPLDSRLEEEFDPLEAVTQIPAEDPEVYDMICQADTIGVFQIESRAQMAMLPRLRPRRFYDLVIEVAIVRPGPIQGGMVHPYLRRRNGEEGISCPHPDLWPILERTLGVPLFQEQVMQISIVGAGYSGGEADQLRRDMAAWKKTGKLMRHKQRLLDGFSEKGIDQNFGKALFEQIKGFGDYGFPESHASSFALLVYASSWEKAHYPAHFVAAVLNSQPMGFYSPSTLVRDAQKHGVEVRDVSVAHSDWDCTLEPVSDKSRIRSEQPGAQRALRLGLRLVKGLGKGVAQRIEAARVERAFSSLEDFTRRVSPRKDELEALAESGALEALVSGRRQALWQVRAPRMTGLFAEAKLDEAEVRLPALKATEQLILDYGTKGLCVHDHPMRHMRARLQKRRVVRAADLLHLNKGAKVSVAGLVLSRQQPGTASGVVFVTLEDETGFANLILYRQVFERFHLVARHSTLLLARGEVEREVKPSDPRSAPVIHVIVEFLERLDGPGKSISSISRDFH